MKLSKTKNMRFATRISIFIAFFLLTIAIAVNLLGEKETRLTNGDENYKIDSLSCSGENIADAFFSASGELDANHDIKFTFEGGIINSISYVYSASFDTENEAKAAINELHAKYNFYMGDIGIYQENLTPTFNNFDKKVVINLFINGNNFTSGTANFLFINPDEFLDIGNGASEKLPSIYKNKGISCIDV